MGLTMPEAMESPILSFLLHCSRRLQPLDISVYEPFKKHINSSCDVWFLNHPDMGVNPGGWGTRPPTFRWVGDTISNVLLHLVKSDVVALFDWLSSNIFSCFRTSGIYLYNKDIFSDSDFDAALVTDRELLQTNQEQIRTLELNYVTPPSEDEVTTRKGANDL
ncbi:hypothetical protein HOLleu_37310 [Holothuria leucospilota]|uniref:Uncharacterized protein n=1 Tax=Holothuria leucospilota TaxID=206669 RepID=A0A9Q0YHU8_HOLLE|nr:hypothetical protein HOLleu_37310 [Holothuria leucospilota]